MDNLSANISSFRRSEVVNHWLWTAEDKWVIVNAIELLQIFALRQGRSPVTSRSPRGRIIPVFYQNPLLFTQFTPFATAARTFPC
jgi:hypothetical protein